MSAERATNATVYSVSHSDGIIYLPTKREAMNLARQLLADNEGDFVHIVKIGITNRLGRRELYCALLNGEQFAASQEDIEIKDSRQVAAQRVEP